ncbi:MAG: hypothetical protein U9N35_03290 [Euryarchaeota archaeon]|nr:hypothetical protein [Euryarchaeota archaeon]
MIEKERDTKTEGAHPPLKKGGSKKENKEEKHEIKADRTDIIAFIIALWQLFLPLLLVFIFMFIVALLIAYFIL